MKILESIIWLPEEQLNGLKHYVHGFVPIIKGDIAQSLRMPHSDEYIWNYYLLNSEREEDQYLFENLEGHIISHVFILSHAQEDLIERAERLVERFGQDYDVPPLFFFHFLTPSEKINKSIQKKFWQLEKNVFISWQQNFFPIMAWNKFSIQYLEKVILTTQNHK